MKALWLTSCCAICLTGMATAAQAQDDGDRNATEASASSGGIEDIIVTAQRREENLQNAAIAVSAVGGEDLVRAGVTDPTALTNLVPALNVSNAAGPYALYYLRGVGNFNGNALSDSAIAVNLDGVFLARPSSTAGLFYDIERVEVLKGPQGTLYGRNATGGAINIITRRPELGQLGGELTASYGNYDAVQVSGAINLPLDQKAAVRVSGQYVNHDGYMTDGTSDQDDVAGRAQLRFEPSDTVTIQIGADYYEQNGRGVGATILTDAYADRRIGLGDPRSDAAYQSIYYFPAGNLYSPVADDTYLNNKFWGAYASLELDADFATVTTIAGYRGGKLDYRSNSPLFLINQHENDDEYTLELRLASKGEGPLEWLAGAYYIKEDISVPAVSFNQQFSGSYQQFEPGTSSLAFFGRATYSLSDTFRLNAGARYTMDRKSFEGTLTQLSILCEGTVLKAPLDPVQNCFGAPTLPTTLIPGPVFLPDGSVIPFQPFGIGAPFPNGPQITQSYLTASQFSLNRKADFNKFTWRAGFEWDVLDRSLLYGSYETGFKSGGFFFTIDNPVYQPETIKAWTLGMKNRFFDNRLQLNLEAFWWNYSGQQVSSVSRDSAGNVVFATRNIGKSTNRGFEVEALGLITPTTELSLNLQYLHAKYDKFIYTTPNFSPQVPGLVDSVPPTTNCPYTLSNPTTLYVQDCSGRSAPNAPKWVAQFGVKQTIELGGWKAVLDADTRYQSSTFTGLEYLAVQVQDSYWTSNASITFSPESDNYFVTAFVNNIENNDVLAASYADPFGGPALVGGTIRPPRTYGVRAGVRF